MEQAVGQFDAFGCPANRPCPSEQGFGVNGNAVGHLFQIRDDFEVQAAPMSGRMLLEALNQGLRNILDGQSCHGNLLCKASVMVPLWILAEADGTVKQEQMRSELEPLPIPPYKLFV